jgi:hypothetical protein
MPVILVYKSVDLISKSKFYSGDWVATALDTVGGHILAKQCESLSWNPSEWTV